MYLWSPPYLETSELDAGGILRHDQEGFSQGLGGHLTWRYLSWRAEDDSAMTKEASLGALEAILPGDI